MRFSAGNLDLIDQRYLPHSVKWISCNTAEQVATSIENMVVRGAPAIGCAAAYGLAIDAHHFLMDQPSSDREGYQSRFITTLERLANTRPTAVNLFYALNHMRAVFNQLPATAPMKELCARLTEEADRQFNDDLTTCRRIGEHGAKIFEDISRPLQCITHCNAGSLATAGYGTALGVIRSLHHQKRIERVYADETRPFLQGARLTMFELIQEGIPATLICDSAAAFLMQRQKIDFVIVGADRIAANGDVANKIGTYSLAIAAARHGVPFYVAAPLSTFDLSIRDGSAIPIELRAKEEVTHHAKSEVAPSSAEAWNPSFDVTPADLIKGVITEKGFLQAPYSAEILNLRKT